MADPVNRIIPSTVAPERYSVLRREREEKNRNKHRNTIGARGAFPASSETENISPDNHDEPNESSQDKAKGKILDINA